MTDTRGGLGFYTRTDAGVLRCRLCLGLHGGHAADCGVVQLRLQVQELSGQLGLYVATVRELLEHVDTLVRGDQVPL